MSLLQLLKINLTLCFLFITNINSVNAQSINNSDNKCNFITGKYSDELSDLKSFQSKGICPFGKVAAKFEIVEQK